MTVEEFEVVKTTLVCRHCSHVGLTTHYNPNNGGICPACPRCGRSAPVEGVQWLKQNRADGRRPRRPKGDPSPDEVWRANGDHCAFCGKSRDLCKRVGLGLTAQHVHPVVFGGHDSPLIPFCSRCQHASTAALEETRRIEEHVSGLWAVIRRIEKKTGFTSDVLPDDQ